MENTSNDAVLKNRNALNIVSDNNTDNNFALKENYNGMIDATLNYLNKILLEEEIHEKDIMYPALWAMEKDFYNVLGEEYPFLLNKFPRSGQQEADPSGSYSPLQHQISFSSTELSVSGFNQVAEKGTNVLPSADNMAINFQAKKNLVPPAHKVSADWVKTNLDNEENENQFSMINRSRGKMKSNNEDLDLIVGHKCKISASNLEEPSEDAIFDEMLLSHDFYTKEVAGLRKIMQANPCNEKKIQERIHDVKDLLIHCSHSIAANDRKTAEGLIKEVRKQSSPDGDGNQRLAHVLADALEARLTVTGCESYNRVVAKQISTALLKAHRLYMTAAPFEGISFCFANQTILKAVDKASKLHIIDFGILVGFQWPSLIQNLSNRKGGPIKLRITGIEFPQPGFRPAELVEETGRRLKEYATMFHVPFEYHGIASSQWETIGVNDFKIKTDEVLIVNSMYRFRQLGDETTGLDCPRDKVLKLIQHARPHIFIFGIFNWTFSPFFVTRFKQSMSLFETMFDLLDTLIPRDNEVREFIERDMLACVAINLIACEGTIRIERPETYKRWHQRTLQSGFEQLPPDPTIVKKCKESLREFYDDKKFFVEEESKWFLQGWRGRILYGLSIWKPK